MGREVVIDGFTVVMVNGLAANTAVATLKSNLWFGTGLLNDTNMVKVIDTADTLGDENVRIIMRMTAGTQLLKNKLAINVNASMDPYAINANGRRIDVFNINNGGSLFRLTNANLSANYSISSKDIGKNKDEKGKSNSGGTNVDSSSNMFGENLTKSNQQINTDEEKVKKATLYRTVMPWDLKVRYSLTYSNAQAQNDITSNSVQVSGNIEFSPKWRVGVSSGYDFENSGITYTQLRFERDLDSWRFSFNWVPFGDRATYYFFIGIKSNLLKDLKYDKRRLPDKRL